MLDSLVMCTVYTNKFTFGQLKLRLSLYQNGVQYKLYSMGSMQLSVTPLQNIDNVCHARGPWLVLMFASSII